MLRLRSHVSQFGRMSARIHDVRRLFSTGATGGTINCRQLFVDFFSKNRSHVVVPSSALVPRDASLLFTNAGMVQFKPVFVGDETPAEDRVVTVQKCVRAGGKHNDLENVGRTSRHLTFFEMLGNFQLGRFDKRDAIRQAWLFLTETLQLPPHKLRMTVLKGDDDTRMVWQDVTGWNDAEMASNVLDMGTEDNFWAMGESGPCGPCTEVFWDQGVEVDGDRWLEVWNIVFMQHHMTVGGGLTALKSQFVDTGAGLERLQMVLENKQSPYDTHLFQPLVVRSARLLIENESSSAVCYQEELRALLHRYESKDGYSLGLDSSDPATALKVICDHLRSSVMLILDGVVPGNTGRHYVLRKIIRRALTHQYLLTGDARTAFIMSALAADPASCFPSSFLEAYPELSRSGELLHRVLSTEERLFSLVLKTADDLLASYLGSLSNSETPSTLSGEVAFEWYHTHGIPMEVTEALATKAGFTAGVGKEQFDVRMREERARSSEHWQGSGDALVSSVLKRVAADSSIRNSFEGYTGEPVESAVLAIDTEETDAGDVKWIMLQPCLFYPHGKGGQTSDMGYLDVGGRKVSVLECVERFPGCLFVKLNTPEVHLCVGDVVWSHVDMERRRNVAVHHSATHMLHHVLRERNPNISQQGSFVEEDRLRFDFLSDSELGVAALREIETQVNAMALGGGSVSADDELLQDALARGAVALFSEKYSDTVRVVQLGDSLELCGGTHVQRLDAIYPFVIVKAYGIASGVRRIEAVAGRAGHAFLRDGAFAAQQASRLLNTSISDVPDKIAQIQTQNKTMAKEHKKSALELALIALVGVQSSQCAQLLAAAHDTRLNVTRLPPAIEVRTIFQAVSTLVKGHESFSGGKIRIFLCTSSHAVIVACSDVTVPKAFLLRALGTWLSERNHELPAQLTNKKDTRVIMAHFPPRGKQSDADWETSVAQCCLEASR